MHFIEEGNDNIPILFLHGNPTSSYLWRNIIPIVSNNTRCIALDLIGFGKSAKPDIDYSFEDHYGYVEAFIEAMQLRNIVIVGHDWGGILGFWYAYNHQENVRGLAFMETFPFTFTLDVFPTEVAKLFQAFRTPDHGYQLIQVQNIFVEQVLPSNVLNKKNVTEEVMENYRQPFPTIESRKPIRRFPEMLPLDPNVEKEAYDVIRTVEESLASFKFPMLLIKGNPGAIISEKRVKWLKERIPNLLIKDIGPSLHYLQEDNPEGIGNSIADWIKILM
jgi:pimeloyl-ACP methyl ester carboxylesterase